MTTTSSNGAIVDQVEGLVEAVNDRGIKLGGEWRNLSKFHPLELPGQGARVRLSLDTKGFIRTLEDVDGAPTTGPATSTARDRTITRLVVLKAAANFLGLMGQSREEVKWIASTIGPGLASLMATRAGWACSTKRSGASDVWRMRSSSTSRAPQMMRLAHTDE
jgi:hypothetical protein